MKKLRNARLSESEHDIMKLLWENPPLSVADIAAALALTHGWKAQTVYVLTHRLVEKGYATLDRSSQPIRFSPTMTEAEYLAKASEKSLFSLVASFLGSESVTMEDIDALSELIEAKRRELENKN